MEAGRPVDAFSSGEPEVHFAGKRYRKQQSSAGAAPFIARLIAILLKP
jgi:hypothetical protein